MEQAHSPASASEPHSLREAAGDLAFTDELTGLHNYRLLANLFDCWWMDLVHDHDQLSLIIIDLDRFKEVNDTHGHLVGDQVLRATAGALRSSFRTEDVRVRYGGDEFVVVLPGAGTEDARALVDRARQALAEALGHLPDGLALDIPVSFSLGVASLPADGSTGWELLEAADQRLLTDKRQRQGAGLGRRTRARLLGTVAAGLLAVLAGLALLGRWPGQPEGAPSAELTASALREAGLRDTIQALERQLAELQGRARREPPLRNESYSRQVEALEARLAQLQGELEQRGPEAVPTPPAEVAAAPEEAAASTTGTQPPSPGPDGAVEVVPPEAPGPRVGAAPPEAEAAVAPSIVPPVLVRITKPRYPVAARGMRREAAVELRVKVNASGRVVDVEPVGGSVGLGFDFEARQAAWSAVYEPGTVDGVPTEQETTLTVRFRLDQ